MNSTTITVYSKKEKGVHTIFAVTPLQSYVHCLFRDNLFRYLHVFGYFDKSLVKGFSKIESIDEVETISPELMLLIKGSLQQQDEVAKKREIEVRTSKFR